MLSQEEKTDILIKHSSAIHVLNNTSAVERKIANILLKNAYDKLLLQESHSIQIREIANLLGWQPDDSYHQIKKCLKKLISTTIEWNIFDKDKKNIWSASTFISSATIKAGMCQYSYSPELRKLLSSPNIYAKLNMFIQAKLSSKYSLALWEFFVEALCSEKKQVIHTSWIKLEKIKKLLGVHGAKGYEEFKNLNRDILKKAIEEINEVSDVKVSLNYKRESRKVVALSFTINKKSAILAPNTLSNDNISIEAKKNLQLKESSKNPALFEKLENEYSIPKATITKILKEYPSEKVSQSVEYVEIQKQKTNIKNPKAYFLKALKENWSESEENSKNKLDKVLDTPLNLEEEPEIWQQISALLIREHGESVYRSWFSKLKFVEINKEKNLILKPLTNFYRSWISNNYLTSILRQARNVNKQIKEVILEHIE